ncbi:right-handed parallel beta-helix repeat-containing protein [Candidatus Altiarchaeota archaeon]
MGKYGGNRMRFFAITLAVLLSFSVPVVADNCGGSTICNCSDTIVASYNMTTDLNCSGIGGDGLIFGANYVELDCRGHMIYRNVTSLRGIELIGFNHSIIRNCRIEGFSENVYTRNTINTTIINCTFQDNGLRHIFLYQSHNGTVQNNLFIDGRGGIRIRNSNWNAIQENTFINQSRGTVVSFDDSHNNTLSSNILANNSADGISIGGSSDNTFSNNTIEKVAGKIGIYVTESNNIDESNTINGLPIQFFDGVYRPCPNGQTFSFDSTNQNISHLQFNGCTGITVRNLNTTLLDAITLTNTNDSTIENCESGNNWIGINIRDSHGNTIRDNQVYNNSVTGINVNDECLDNIFRNNTILTELGDEGLDAQSRNDIDESNTINGLPIQYYDGTYRSCPDNQILQFNSSDQNISHLGLVGCNNVTVQNLNTTRFDNIDLVNTTNSQILGCESSDNYIGVRLISNSDDNTVIGCTIQNASAWGILLSGSDRNNISFNIINNSGEGIVVESSYDNEIYYNNISNSMSMGIELSGETDNVFYGNRITYSDSVGIYISYGENNEFYENFVCYSEFVDIEDDEEANSGDDNTCDTTSSWNDEGEVSGCTNSCPTTTTTSTTSTTSTLCILPNCHLLYTGWNLMALSITP